MLPNVLQPREADHVPVLAEEVRACLAVQPGETVVDGTFGAGGHSAILAADLRGKGKLIAIDRDPTARTYFEQLAKRTTVNTRLLRGDFGVVLPQLAGNDVRADAILLDLGVSSMQLDRPERGFSYAADAPLDMRMDPSADVTAVLRDGTRKHVFVEHAIGSLERPMGDRDLEGKFHSLADAVIGEAAAKRVIDACWKIGGAADVNAVVEGATP